MNKFISPLIIILGMSFLTQASRNGPSLQGVWKAVAYKIGDTHYPLQGLIIFTEKYFSSNVIFKLTKGAIDDANCNAGLYKADGKKIVFNQWIQIHLRPGQEQEPIFLNKDTIEEAAYKLEGNSLLITFPSNNQFTLEKIKE